MNVVFFELHLIWWSMISVCSIIGEVYFEHLHKIVASGLFHCKGTLLLLKTNKCFWKLCEVIDTLISLTIVTI